MIRSGEPAAFGFLDHDIFPTAINDPFAQFAERDVYGVIRQAGSRSFLWTGFCMFRFAVRHNALDFGQDWFIGLDTGGGNWRPLYRGIERATLPEQPAYFIPFMAGVALVDGALQCAGPGCTRLG